MPALPIPTVTQARLIECAEDWTKLPSASPDLWTSWIFREDTFDPATRTRRGRLYEPAMPEYAQPTVLRDIGWAA